MRAPARSQVHMCRNVGHLWQLATTARLEKKRVTILNHIQDLSFGLNPTCNWIWLRQESSFNVYNGRFQKQPVLKCSLRLSHTLCSPADALINTLCMKYYVNSEFLNFASPYYLYISVVVTWIAVKDFGLFQVNFAREALCLVQTAPKMSNSSSRAHLISRRDWHGVLTAWNTSCQRDMLFIGLNSPHSLGSYLSQPSVG